MVVVSTNTNPEQSIDHCDSSNDILPDPTKGPDNVDGPHDTELQVEKHRNFDCRGVYEYMKYTGVMTLPPELIRSPRPSPSNKQKNKIPLSRHAIPVIESHDDNMTYMNGTVFFILGK